MSRITAINTSIFDSISDYLVCPVNKIGVMGAGLAKQFKIKYPECERSYLRYLSFLKEFGFLIQMEDRVIHLATKEHWKNPSELAFIQANLIALIQQLNSMGQSRKKSISFPKLGCGLGGLKWHEVKVMMVKELCILNDSWDVFIHE